MVSSVTGATLLSYYQGQSAVALLGSGSQSSSGSTSLFGGTTSSTNSSSGANTSAALLGYLQAKEGLSSSSASSAAANAPAAPWQTGALPSVSSGVQSVINGQQLIDPSAAKLSAPAGTSANDYKNLFALYQGLNSLMDVAQTAASSDSSTTPTAYSASTLQGAFASGLSQVQSFLASDPFSSFNVTTGQVSSSEQSSFGIPTGTSQTYSTGVVYTGDLGAAVPSFSGNVQFAINVQNEYEKNPTTVNINLANMGTEARTMTNVVNYINAQLKAAGVATTFSVAGLGNASVTSYVNGNSTTTAGSPQWGFQVNGTAAEAVSFSAPSTAAAVYVTQQTGGATTVGSTAAATATGQQLLKLQTSNDAVGSGAPASASSTANANLPYGGVFANGLPSGVNSVDASATSSDGSVYMVANVSGAVNGAPVSGQQGVALLKYNASGQLLYSKVLSDGADATGYSLAVNSDGSVAVAGSNTTASSTAPNGVTTAGATSAFVQVFDSTGAPTWNATVPAAGGTSTATGIAFGANDTVYLSGTTTGSVGAQAPSGGTSDEFIQGFNSTGTATFTKQYGATGGDNTSGGVAYDAATNTLYTVGSENAQGVVRSFALNATGAVATAGATRNIGNVANVLGIAVDSGQVVVGGNVNAPTIHMGTVAKAYTGVGAGFVASMSASLTPSSSDTVSYVGTSGGTQTATAFTEAGGQAYLAGTIANDPNSLVNPGDTEGFVTGVSTSTGAISYSTRLAGANGQDAPSAITVATSGSSVLDTLGLPEGPINISNSTLLTANTSIKAGQSFYVRTSPTGTQTAITVTATDTLASLTDRLNAALSGAGTASVINLGAKSEISITPLNTTSYVELNSTSANPSPVAASSSSSSSGNNVLAALGLNTGVLYHVKVVDGLTDPSQMQEYGLNLPNNLSVATAADAKQASVALQAALGQLQQAYQTLVSPPTLASEAAQQAQSSSVPSYLTTENANLTAGLQRLLGTG